jgi:hypothetical protein
MSENKYKVEDIIPENREKLKVLFVFESPYKQELINGYPVAGGSGKTISKFLNKIDDAIPANIPFGQFMTFFKDVRFGIANCSNYPMDKAAYETDSDVPFPPEDLDIIRKKLTSSGKVGKSLDETYSKMRQDFKLRIEKYIEDKTIIIVLCGKIAHNFYHDSELSLPNKVISVPHPSRNQWVYKKFEDIMSNLAAEIRKQIV